MRRKERNVTLREPGRERRTSVVHHELELFIGILDEGGFRERDATHVIHELEFAV